MDWRGGDYELGGVSPQSSPGLGIRSGWVKSPDIGKSVGVTNNRWGKSSERSLSGISTMSTMQGGFDSERFSQLEVMVSQLAAQTKPISNLFEDMQLLKSHVMQQQQQQQSVQSHQPPPISPGRRSGRSSVQSTPRSVISRSRSPHKVRFVNDVQITTADLTQVTTIEYSGDLQLRQSGRESICLSADLTIRLNGDKLSFQHTHDRSVVCETLVSQLTAVDSGSCPEICTVQVMAGPEVEIHGPPSKILSLIRMISVRAGLTDTQSTVANQSNLLDVTDESFTPIVTPKIPPLPSSATTLLDKSFTPVIASVSGVTSDRSSEYKNPVFVQYEEEVEKSRLRELQRTKERDEERERIRQRWRERREQREREYDQELLMKQQQDEEREWDLRTRREKDLEREQHLREAAAAMSEQTRTLELQKQEEILAIKKKELELSKYATLAKEREHERSLLAEAAITRDKIEMEQRSKLLLEEELQHKKHEADRERFNSMVLRRQNLLKDNNRRFDERRLQQQLERQRQKETSFKAREETTNIIQRESEDRQKHIKRMQDKKLEEQQRRSDANALRDLAAKIASEEKRLQVCIPIIQVPNALI